MILILSEGHVRFAGLVSAIALTFGLAGAMTPAAGQQGTVVINGRVLNAQGQPVSGIAVTARGVTTQNAVTNDAGRYRLGPVPAGAWVVRVEGIGYRTGEQSIEAAAGTVTVDFEVEEVAIALTGLQVVAATRTGAAAATLPIKVDVIEAREIQVQQGLASNPTEVLSNVIPSFSPARQKLTSAGESFRGRRPLFLVDGVPQSNPLRDGRRDGFTVDMEAIERVEVIFGANAIQGLGATGGIINYVTVSPPKTGRLEQRVSLGTTSSDGFDDDGFGWRGQYMAGKRFGSVDVLGSVSYEERGLQYDGRERAIGVDNVQGDIADSNSRNFLGKVGWEPDGNQRVQLMVNSFRLAQQGNFDIVAGDRAAGTPAVSVPGQPEGTEPVNEVFTAALDYEHTLLAGGRLSAKAYYQDFSALFGGGRFATFQDPLIAPVGELFDQSQNNSEKYGTRLTYARAGVAGMPVDVITGFDFLRDMTYQSLVQTDRNWVPVTEFFNYAPFVQLDHQPLGWLSISGGMRWELAKLDVPDFTTLAGNRADHQRVEVAGGSPGFDEPLFNIGGVITPISGLRFYGTFSQAFTMPDVGRVLRGISEEGTAVGDFLALQPVKTDNIEFGGTFGTSRALVGATWFQSASDFGSRLVPNADGIFQVMREPTRTHGWELTGRFEADPRLAFNAGYSMLRGSFDGDDDGTYESDLSAADIGPDRLNLAIDLNRGRRVSGRLQSFTFFDRDFRNGAGDVTAQFDGYTTVDGSVSAALGITTITLSASNLLDEQYITYFGQAATNLADRYFAGRGRTFSLRAETRF